MRRLQLISVDDWQGLYLDGILITEDHSIEDPEIWIKVVSENNLTLDDFITRYIGDSVDEDFTNFPKELKDLKL